MEKYWMLEMKKKKKFVWNSLKWKWKWCLLEFTHGADFITAIRTKVETMVRVLLVYLLYSKSLFLAEVFDY